MTSILTCICGYSCVKAASNGDLRCLAYLYILFLCLISTYLICANGTMISHESDKMHLAAYQNKWYEQNIQFKKDLLIVSTVADKTLTLHYRRLLTFDMVRFAMVDSDNNNSITFHEIVGKVNWMGGFLVKDGIKKGDVIAILSKNSIDYCWLVLGALQAGAVCALFSPNAKRREIEHFVSLTKPKYVIAPTLNESQLNVLIDSSDIEAIFTINDDTGVKKVRSFEELLCSDHNTIEANIKWKGISCNADLDDPALILSSSGSTGLPKGVMLRHNNLICALYHSKLFMRQNATALGLMPFYHAYGLGLMLMALHEGSKLISMSKFSMDTFLTAINYYQISHLYLVPSLVTSLAKMPSVTKKLLSPVNEVFTGAGAITTKQQNALLEKLNPNAKLYHSYGMTETTFVVMFGEFREDKPSSSGTLVPGINAKIVSVDGSALETGQIGELYLKGSLIMSGYFKNEKATKETIDNMRWLHTGDLAFKDLDGYYYIVERIKEIIKYQGFQVSPTELELVLAEHKGIAEVAVVGIPHETFGEVPRAYIVRNEGYDISEDEIKSMLNSELSPYKQLKGGVQFVKQLPKSPSGKILKRILKEEDNILSQ